MVRSSLGRAVLADSGGLEEEYPYYGISVPDFLNLTEWLPHEALKASGKVKQMGEADEVIFVSHQWCSFSHPVARGARDSYYASRHRSLATQDPAGNQLRALQTQIRTYQTVSELDAVVATFARWRRGRHDSSADARAG